MIIVPVKDGENIERALKKFRRKFEKTGVVMEAVMVINDGSDDGGDGVGGIGDGADNNRNDDGVGVMLVMVMGWCQ